MKPFLLCRPLARLAAVAFLLVSAAAPAVKAAPPAPKLPPRMVYIEVVSTDPAVGTITVRPRNSMSIEAKTYKVTPATKIMVNGNPAALTDLKAGLQVHFHLLADGTTADELTASHAPRGSE